MRICFLSEEFPPEYARGGISTYVVEMATAMVRQGHSVAVVVRTKHKKDILNVESGVCKYRLYSRSPIGGLPFFWRFANDLKAYLKRTGRFFRALDRQLNFDVVEAAEFRFNALKIGRKGREKLVTRLHSPRRIIQKINGKEVDQNMDRMEFKQIQSSKLITMPSEALEKLANNLELTKSKQTVVIPNPIRVIPVPPIEKKFRICFVGRLEIGKGIGELIEALPEVFSVYPKLEVAFYGSIGPCTSHSYTWKEKALDVIPAEFHNQLIFDKLPRRKLLDEMAKTVLFVLPSKWDNFPYVLLESMMLGVPGLISNNGGLSEMVIHEENGWIMPDIEPSTISNHLIKLLADQEMLKKAGLNAREHIIKHYSSEVIADKMIKVFEQV